MHRFYKKVKSLVSSDRSVKNENSITAHEWNHKHKKLVEFYQAQTK